MWGHILNVFKSSAYFDIEYVKQKFSNLCLLTLLQIKPPYNLSDSSMHLNKYILMQLFLKTHTHTKFH